MDSSPAIDGSAPAQVQAPGPITNSLNLPTEPTISVRLGVACKTDVDGQGSCWGSRVPVPQQAIHKVVLGRAHGCALMQTGEISCWGSSSRDAEELTGHRFTDAASTLHTTCGLTAQGALHCFGRDLGRARSQPQTRAVAPKASVNRVEEATRRSWTRTRSDESGRQGGRSRAREGRAAEDEFEGG